MNDTTKKVKSGAQIMVWVAIAYATIRLALLFFGDIDPGVSLTTIFIGLIPVIGAYLAIDFTSVIKSTHDLPKGQFNVADKWKYIRMIIAIGVLSITCMVLEALKAYSLEAELTLLTSSLFGMISIYVAGMKINKVMTKPEGEQIAINTNPHFKD